MSSNGTGRTPDDPDSADPADVSLASAPDLQTHLYTSGFVHGQWADTLLRVPPHTSLRLHSLVLARSPALRARLAQCVPPQQPPYDLQLNCADPHLSAHALSLALATLYGRPLGVDASNTGLDEAAALLAAGSLLGLRDVAAEACGVIDELVAAEALPELFAFALAPVAQPAAVQDYNAAEIGVDYAGPYPRYTSTLTAKLARCLADAIPAGASAQQLPVEIRELLLSLPFGILKHVCESERLRAKSQMERYAFARDLTGERERRRRAQRQSSGYEETVVLAFGDGKGGVEVIRKPLGRKKVLWKASR
ncbi:uncharacterized protein V1518DRAFT_445612 [Limtongia smithiae]|uniref:uncharacterized protein n=1 Tax=Limtongia smithiae TaxID=1125753 RepID=UPI0034CE3B22